MIQSLLLMKLGCSTMRSKLSVNGGYLSKSRFNGRAKRGFWISGSALLNCGPNDVGGRYGQIGRIASFKVRYFLLMSPTG